MQISKQPCILVKFQIGNLVKIVNVFYLAYYSIDEVLLMGNLTIFKRNVQSLC